MATLYLAEFSRLLTDAHGDTVMAPHYPPVAPEQTVAITSSSVQCGAAFSGHTRFIQVSADHACSVAIGANPTADATLTRLAANEKQFIGVERGHFIAVISNT